MRLLLMDKPVPEVFFHMKESFSIVKKNPDIIYTQLTPIVASVPVFCPCTGTDHIKAPKIVNLYDKDWLEWNVLATAEHTMLLILALAKNLARNMVCDRRTILSKDLRGRRILIVGYGRVGRQVGRLAKCFGMTVDTVEEGTHFDIVEKKLELADVVTFHIPLNKDTEGMVDHLWFRSMKPGTIVVNTSRSGIFNEAAVRGASKRVQIAVDVSEGYSQETLDCLCLNTPHVAGYSDYSRKATDYWILEKMLEYKERNGTR